MSKLLPIGFFKKLPFRLQGCFSVLSFFLGLAGFASADQVTLSNGDRLTGEVGGLAAKTLRFRSPIVGEVRIPLKRVSSLKTKRTYRLTLRSGRALIGTLEKFEAGVWVLRHPDFNDPLRISNAEVRKLDTHPRIASAATAEGQKDGSRLASLLPKGWQGKFSMGLAHRSGNTDSFGLNVRANLAQRTRFQRITLEGNYERKETQGVLETDKGNLSGRYDYLFTDRAFAFALAELETDRAEELDLRHKESVGPGYFFIKTDRTELSGEIGPSLIQEFFRDGSRRTHMAGRVAAAWEQKVWNSKLSVKGAFLPKFPAPRTNFLANGKLTFSTPITHFLSWELIVTDEYDNNPEPGVEKNDVSVNTNLAVKF